LLSGGSLAISRSLHVLGSVVIWKWVVLLFLVPLAVRGQSRDTIVMRDTLIESRYTIEHAPLRAGFEPIVGRSSYASSFPEPSNIAGCDLVDRGSGPIYGLRAFGEIPFWGDLSPWKFEPGLYFEITKPTFEYLVTLPGYDSKDHVLRDVIETHDVASSVAMLGIESRMQYGITKAVALHGGVGFEVALSKSFEKTTRLSGALTDGRNETTDISGNLSSKLMLLPSATIGASYEIPLSKKLRAAPSIELSYAWAIGDSGVYWNGFEMKAGVSFMFDLTPRRETVPTFIKQQVPVVVHREPPVDTSRPLTASIEAVALNRNGQESKVVEMRIEEVRTRNSSPILNYIFFDENSLQFPERYVVYSSSEEAQRSFKGSSQREGAKLMELYRETLNILGDRLTKYPKATVRLIGSTGGNEPNGIQLARARAERVKEYLVNMWKIDASRIRTDAKLLPDRPSPTTTSEGREENRRVEFQVDDERVTDPIVITNIEHLATPDQIKLHPTVSRRDIATSYASIQAAGNELISFKGIGNSAKAEKIWAPTEEMLSKIHDSLSIEYDVADSAGHHAHAHSAISLDVKHVASDRPEKVERYSLILFGFDESRLERRNDREVRRASDMIAHIPVERIVVQGYTDETGDPQHNDRLSEARATQVAQRLTTLLEQAKLSGIPQLHAEGRGSRDLLYDNALPEGRFFSRTVTITIERAIR
jgi:outer membrane protein OmpA-like peptidoglycan-associated protein